MLPNVFSVESRSLPRYRQPEGALASSPRVALIYREQLLPYSETFILAQGESCVTHQCWYVGLTAIGRAAWALAPDGSQQAALRQKSILLASLMWPSQLWKLVYRLWGVVIPVWRRSLQVHSPRLIHAHFGPDGGFAASLAKALNIPLIVTFHGYDATWRAERDRLNICDLLWRRGDFFKALALQRRRVPFRAASKVIAVSQFIRRELISLGCPPEKIVVHYTGIDLRLFQPCDTVARQRIVLFVGRLVEKKGCAVLIDAMRQVQARLAQLAAPAARLVIIGSGGLRSPLEARAAGLAHCEFLGAITPAQVRQWMNRAWLLCAPSLTARSGDTEGLGMVLLEAQAMGLPVVATHSGGIPEAVIDQKTGLLVPEQDTPALAQAILRLLQDQALRDRLASAGRSHVKQRFDLHKNTAQLEQLYDTVVQQYQTLTP